MVTLKKYLDDPSGAAGDAASARAFCDALVHLSNALLEGLEQHIFSEPHSTFQTFATEAANLRQRLDGDVDPDGIQTMSEGIAALLADFRQTRDQVQQTEASEVQKMVAMLNETITVLASGSERSQSRLRQLESDLKGASGLSDMVALRARLNACMVYVREERTKEQQESARNIAEVETGVKRAQEGFALARTGIATRSEAEKCIQASVGSAEIAMAVVVLDLLPTIKTRFNQITAERFLSSFAQDLGERLPTPNRLFRWNEQSLLVELPGSKFYARRMTEVRERLGLMPRERQLNVGPRAAVFSNAHRWTLMRLADCPTLPDAVTRIDQFVEQ